MTEPRDTGVTTPTFRRATEADALALARAMFLANERVDLNTLAGRLNVSRATLHRWVHTRVTLLDQVLGQLAAEFLEEASARARQRPDDAVAELAHALVSATSGFAPLRGFAQREPELCLRVLLADDGSVRRCLRAGVQALIEVVYPDEAPQLTGFTDAIVQIGLALEWATVAAGGDPSADRIAQYARALLAAARAGELPPDPAHPANSVDQRLAVHGAQHAARTEATESF